MSQIRSIAMVPLICAALVSGAAALAYEVCWSRMMVVPLGNSTDATALVLASFMIGMAAGAFALGYLADKVRSPLAVYMFLEIALGSYALAVPFMIKELGATPFFIGSLADNPAAFFSRYAAAFLIVFVPSGAMGATLPVLVRAAASGPSSLKKRIGMIYGANVIGAALGSAVTGFLTVPEFGLRIGSSFGVCGSIAASFLAFVGIRVTGRFGSDPQSETVVEMPSRANASAGLIAAFTGGFAMLASETLWARTLTFVFGHDTYAFAVLLSVVLLGLGIGGAVHRSLASKDQALLSGALLGILGAALAASFWIASQLVVSYGRDMFGIGSVSGLATSFRIEFARELLYAPVLVLLPSVVAGALFPAACALYAGSAGQIGRRVGAAAFANGMGSSIGALVAVFFFVPRFGIQRSMLILCLFAALASIVVFVLAGGFLKRARIALASILLAATVSMSALMPAGMPRAMLLEAVGSRHQRIIHYEEGRIGTVSVTENKINKERQLFMNAVNEVTTRLVHDQSFKLLGHLGPLLHPRPRKMLMICLGAGLTAGAALTHPIEYLDAVDLSPEVARAARLFEAENNGALDDRLFRLHVADGRNFLLNGKERYDVITVDSTHPKAVDSWILYTREFYELVRKRLSDDGIAVQWVPLHGLSEQEFKIIVKTFQTVFPETTLWVNVGFEPYGQAAYVKMVGTLKPLVIDYKELALRLKEPRIKRDLERYGMDAPEEILDCFLGGPESVKAWTDKLPVQTDNMAIVPFTTPFSLGRRMEAPLLLAARSSVVPLLENMGSDEEKVVGEIEAAADAQGFLMAGLLDRAANRSPNGRKIELFEEQAAKGRDYYLSLAKLYLDDSGKLFEIGSYLGNLGFPEDARGMYEKVLSQDPGNRLARLNLGLVLVDLGENREAVEMLSGLVSEEPGNALAANALGVALLSVGDTEPAIRQFERAIEIDPDFLPPRLSLAQALIDSKQLGRAESALGDLLKKNRWIAEAWDMLGLVAQNRRDFATAKMHHIKALYIDPYRATTHYNLGIALQEEGRLKEAVEAYKAAVEIDPGDAEAFNNLGLVYASARLYDLAAESYRKALEARKLYPEAAYNLGLALKAAGALDEAREAFRAALEMKPDLKQAKEQLMEE